MILIRKRLECGVERDDVMLYIDPRKKKKLIEKEKKEEELIRLLPEDFWKLKSIGFTKEQAIKRIKKPFGSLDKLTIMYNRDVERPGIYGISMDNIRRTKDVEKWITEKEEQGLLEDRGDVLKFPANPLLGRYLD